MDQLHGWKEIAGYIGKGVRQAQRWEKLGMPVHRVGGMDGVVFAYRTEIDEWRRSGAGRDAQAPASVPEAGATDAADAIPASSAEARAIRPRPIVWMSLGALVLSIGLGYAYVAKRPLDIALQSPASLPQGGSFRFEASGGDQDLQFAHRVFRSPRGGELLVSPAVPRSADGRFVWVFSTDCLTLPGRHEVFLAGSDGTMLTEAVAIEIQAHPGCSGPVPDLQALSIALAARQVAAGSALKLSFVLTNRGARAAHPSTTRLRLSASALRTSVTDIRLGDVPAPLMEPGDERQFEPEVTIPAGTAPGTYYVWVVVDNGGDNVEALTHNNYLKSVPITVLEK